MSRVDELPADQRAALSLLLRKHKTYAEVASALNISEQAVHDRAHAALAVLAPAQARGLAAADREEIGDYLLGQQPGPGERLRTRTLLAGSKPANAWAAALAGELGELSDEPLPEIPSAPDESATAVEALREPQPLSQAATAAPAAADADTPAGDAGGASFGARPSPPSSRRGGAILLALIVIAGVVAVIVIVSSGGSSKKPPATTASTTAKSGASTGPKAEATIQMHAAGGGSAKGAVEILSEGGNRAFYILAEHLPETKGFFYAVWLYSSPSKARALSKAKPVTSNGRLAGAAALPSNAGEYHEILLTRETSTRPTRPGPVELRGTLSLGG